MDDEAIVDLYLSRNETAIRETQIKYGRRLFQLSLGILQRRSDAEECENDTYLSAWNSIPPNTPKSFLFAYLAKITRNLSLDLYRRSHRKRRCCVITELTLEMEQGLPAPDDCACRVSQVEFSDIMNRFLHGLTERDCNMFLRRYWYCDSIADISRRFSLSQGTVKSNLFRIRTKMKEFLETEGFDL